MKRSQEQPSDLNLGAADPEDDRRTKKRWMDAITEDMCVWILPRRTPGNNPKGEDRAMHWTLCWEHARNERETEMISVGVYEIIYC